MIKYLQGFVREDFLKLTIILMLTVSSNGYALDIDEKLTSRFLKLSATKKTVLINRGLEDGLLVGDHAKFTLPEGVVARGVVVKATPSRSVWSLYRIINPLRVVTGQVLRLKITPPSKLTKDPEKMITAVDSVMVNQGIPLEVGSYPVDEFPDQVDGTIGMEEREEISMLRGGGLSRAKSCTNRKLLTGLSYKYWEVFSLFNYSSQNVVSSVDGKVTSGDNSYINFSLGVERYFTLAECCFRDVSLSLFVHRNTQKITSLQGSVISSGSWDYGGGISWHFPGNPDKADKLIGYLNFSGGLIRSFDEDNAEVEVVKEKHRRGAGNFYSLGIGSKFFFSNGFGGRVLLDYYDREEGYDIDENNRHTKDLKGLRLQAGLSLRW